MHKRYDPDFSPENLDRRWDQGNTLIQTVPPEPDPNAADELQQIAAEIDGLRTNSTTYLNIRPLLLRMWRTIEAMHARIEELENKPPT